MSISELNHFMTYVVEGWMLFSAGFIGIGFISFASKRIQEDLEAEALALAQAEGLAEANDITVAEAVEATLAQSVSTTATTAPANPPETTDTADAPADAPTNDTEEDKDTARLEEVAAVSQQLAQNKGQQSDTSSVSVST